MNRVAYDIENSFFKPQHNTTDLLNVVLIKTLQYIIISITDFVILFI